MPQELADESEKFCSEDEQVEGKADYGKRHTNICQQLSDQER